MAVVLGKDFKTYRNTGTYGTPTWNECDTVSEMAMTGAGEAQLGRTRASGVMKQYAITGIEIGFSWKMLWNLADADMMAMHAAWLACTELDMIFLDGAQTSGAHQGPRLSAAFEKFDIPQGESQIGMAEIAVKPGIGFVPTWFTGTS